MRIARWAAAVATTSPGALAGYGGIKCCPTPRPAEMGDASPTTQASGFWGVSSTWSDPLWWEAA